jgi:hypothetical protein
MTVKMDDFQIKVIEVIREVDVNQVKSFTDSLINLVWAEVCLVNSQSIDAEEISAIAEEFRQSIEIMNPELEHDLFILKKLLVLLENYE